MELRFSFDQPKLIQRVFGVFTEENPGRQPATVGDTYFCKLSMNPGHSSLTKLKQLYKMLPSFAEGKSWIRPAIYLPRGTFLKLDSL